MQVKTLDEKRREKLMRRACEISQEINKQFDASPNGVIGSLSGSNTAKLINELARINKKLGLK